MSGNFAPLPLSNGQLPGSQATIFTSLGTVVTYLKQWLLFNENPATQTIVLYLLPSGGVPSPFRQLTLAQNESAQVLEHGESITLAPGDAIQAVTTTAAAVDYVLGGIQET